MGQGLPISKDIHTNGELSTWESPNGRQLLWCVNVFCRVHLYGRRRCALRILKKKGCVPTKKDQESVLILKFLSRTSYISFTERKSLEFGNLVLPHGNF